MCRKDILEMCGENLDIKESDVVCKKENCTDMDL